jgi:hypothetical protein
MTHKFCGSNSFLFKKLQLSAEVQVVDRTQTSNTFCVPRFSGVLTVIELTVFDLNAAFGEVDVAGK